ncbi:hypothetical protein OAU04_06640 [Alphaproteobacteria bacterium]|nr:hypothetical protein [Alphaproteobacteria bacterium]
MSGNENNANETTEGNENKETVLHVAANIIEPALQKALGEAREQANAQEIISALANCYGGLLVDLMGRKAAATFLQSHALHIASLEEPPVNN